MTPLKLFVANFLLCMVVTANWRAIASLNYTLAFSTDVTYFLLQYAIVRRIVKSDSFLDSLFYALGGACGALLAMWLTKHV